MAEGTGGINSQPTVINPMHPPAGIGESGKVGTGGPDTDLVQGSEVQLEKSPFVKNASTLTTRNGWSFPLLTGLYRLCCAFAALFARSQTKAGRSQFPDLMKKNMEQELGVSKFTQVNPEEIKSPLHSDASSENFIWTKEEMNAKTAEYNTLKTECKEIEGDICQLLAKDKASVQFSDRPKDPGFSPEEQESNKSLGENERNGSVMQQKINNYTGYKAKLIGMKESITTIQVQKLQLAEKIGAMQEKCKKIPERVEALKKANLEGGDGLSPIANLNPSDVVSPSSLSDMKRAGIVYPEDSPAIEGENFFPSPSLAEERVQEKKIRIHSASVLGKEVFIELDQKTQEMEKALLQVQFPVQEGGLDGELQQLSDGEKAFQEWERLYNTVAGEGSVLAKGESDLKDLRVAREMKERMDAYLEKEEAKKTIGAISNIASNAAALYSDPGTVIGEWIVAIKKSLSAEAPSSSGLPPLGRRNLADTIPDVPKIRRNTADGSQHSFSARLGEALEDTKFEKYFAKTCARAELLSKYPPEKFIIPENIPKLKRFPGMRRLDQEQEEEVNVFYASRNLDVENIVGMKLEKIRQLKVEIKDQYEALLKEKQSLEKSANPSSEEENTKLPALEKRLQALHDRTIELEKLCHGMETAAERVKIVNRQYTVT